MDPVALSSSHHLSIKYIYKRSNWLHRPSACIMLTLSQYIVIRVRVGTPSAPSVKQRRHHWLTGRFAVGMVGIDIRAGDMSMWCWL